MIIEEFVIKKNGSVSFKHFLSGTKKELLEDYKNEIRMCIMEFYRKTMSNAEYNQKRPIYKNINWIDNVIDEILTRLGSANHLLIKSNNKIIAMFLDEYEDVSTPMRLYEYLFNKKIEEIIKEEIAYVFKVIKENRTNILRYKVGDDLSNKILNTNKYI